MSIIGFFTPRKNDNWKIIALSVIGATIFWFFNALNKDYNAKVSFPLEYSFARDSVVVMQPLTDKVKVDVAGGGWTLFRKTFWLNATPIIIKLDNPTAVKYYTRSSLRPLISDQLDGLELNYVITDTLFINIEEKVVKKLKVQVDSFGLSLKENYRLVSPIVSNPDTIEVIGPKSIMSRMNLYVWVDMTKNNIDENYDDNVRFLLPDDKLVATNPKEINLKFDVEKFSSVEMPINIELINFPKDSSVYPVDSLIIINSTVMSKLASSISANDFNITLDYTFLNKKDSTISPLLIFAPDNVIDIELKQKMKVKYVEE